MPFIGTEAFKDVLRPLRTLAQNLNLPWENVRSVKVSYGALVFEMYAMDADGGRYMGFDGKPVTYTYWVSANDDYTFDEEDD